MDKSNPFDLEKFVNVPVNITLTFLSWINSALAVLILLLSFTR